MSDETSDESNAKGEEPNNDVTPNKENPSELDKLKASNDKIEEELVRGRKLRAETQQLEAEKMRGGRSEAGSEHLTPKEEINKKAEEQAKEIVDAFN